MSTATESIVSEFWEVLGTISDPCHALSGHALTILDLGLVNRVTLAADTIEVGITLTDVSCTFGYQIVGQIEALADEFPEVRRVRVVIEPVPIWTPDRLSVRARAYYAAARTAGAPRMFTTRVTESSMERSTSYE